MFSWRNNKINTFRQKKSFLSVAMHTMKEVQYLRSGMKATAELPSRAEKAEPDIVFSCICSNDFKILHSFNLKLPYM